MIPKYNLKKISINRLKDAKALMSKRRYEGSIYIVGYSVEAALKYRICQTFDFNRGFPETKSELSLYKNLFSHSSFNYIKNIREIKNHELGKLLFYSGVEFHIKSFYFSEWNKTLKWKPENRYKLVVIRKIHSEIMIESVENILKFLL